MQTKGVTMVENGAFASEDNPLLNNLSSVHFTMKKMATAMKMKFAQSFTALALMNPFTRKIFKPYLVVKKPGLH